VKRFAGDSRTKSPLPSHKRAPARDSTTSLVDVFKTHPTDFAHAKAIDHAKQDRAATSGLNRRRTVDTGKKLSHLFPRRALRQIFVGVKPGRVDGFRDACGAPPSTAGIAKERAQRPWNDTLVRFHLPATVLVKYLVIVTVTPLTVVRLVRLPSRRLLNLAHPVS
jgi:hypothetical protein